MGEVIEATDGVISKEDAAKAGVTITDDSLAVSGDSLAVSSNVEGVIVKEEPKAKKVEAGKAKTAPKKAAKKK